MQASSNGAKAKFGVQSSGALKAGGAAETVNGAREAYSDTDIAATQAPVSSQPSVPVPSKHSSLGSKTTTPRKVSSCVQHNAIAIVSE